MTTRPPIRVRPEDALYGRRPWMARSIESDITSLDRQFHVEAWDCDATLRTVLLHLIHDYARHNGHADLLREGIDGVVGA